jgi:hypothetical protein
MAWRLRRDVDLLLAEAEQRAQGVGRTWVEKIELGVRPSDLIQTTANADPLVELGELMQTEVMRLCCVRIGYFLVCRWNGFWKIRPSYADCS